MNLKKHQDKYGFIHIKNVLSLEELVNLRNYIENVFKEQRIANFSKRFLFPREVLQHELFI